MLTNILKPIISIISLTLFTTFVHAKTEIEFWTTQTQSDRMKIIETLAMTFEAMNPEVKVKVVPIDENEIATQMAAAGAAKNLPNVIEAGSELLLSFGEEGIIDSNLNKSLIEEIGQSRFFTGALAMLQAPDKKKYYGIPMHGWIQGIWYRKDWFAEAGLEPPTTWENIEKAAKTLTNKNKNQYGLLIGTKTDSYTEQVFTHFALSNNAQQFNADGELVFNSPAMLETLTFYQQLTQYNPPGPQTWRARDYYLQGKMAMFFYSTYIMDDLALAEVAKSSLTSEHFTGLDGAEFDKDLVKTLGLYRLLRINPQQVMAYSLA